MGFFDKLLSGGAKKLVSNVFDNAVDQISDAIRGEKSSSDTASGSNTSSSSSSSRAVSHSKAAPVAARLEKIFASDYAEYEIRKEVSPTTIGGTGNFRPYTYGMYLNGEPKAFIMITDHNKEVLRTFRWSKEEAEKNNIPFINFLTQFPNTEEYIKNRLAQNI